MTNKVKACLQIPARKGIDYVFLKRAVEVFEVWVQIWHIAQVLVARVIVYKSLTKFGNNAGEIRTMRYFFTYMGMEGLIKSSENNPQLEEGRFIFIGEQ